MDSSLRLDGKIAFVTGSTRGIGWATARVLAGAGATLAINGVSSQELLDQRVEEIRRDYSVPCVGFLANSTDLQAVQSCYAAVFQRFRRLDILVNNAGILRSGLLGMMQEGMIREVLETNTLGVIYHLQEASRLMARHRSGSIINMTSIFGLRGDEGHAVYSASKAAVVGLTLAAAKELGPKGVRVNAIAPGLIQTEMTDGIDETKLAGRVASIRLGRIGLPQEVANAALFLASDLSSYITGQILGVDGGMVL
ncbi:MAG TPA: SDR family oxidoreductase [Bryobacteraceae bacterium]|nr:SDR family oxidoreductase [Bryobacteraceae bacterium]